jgi:hypothetical protein
MAGPFGSRSTTSSPSSGVGDWLASMAGVDANNPMQPQQSAVGVPGRNQTRQRLLPPWVFFGSP